MSSEPVQDAAPDLAPAIGERLAAHRARRGVKVSALAREIGGQDGEVGPGEGFHARDRLERLGKT